MTRYTPSIPFWLILLCFCFINQNKWQNGLWKLSLKFFKEEKCFATHGAIEMFDSNMMAIINYESIISPGIHVQNVKLFYSD